MEEQNCPVCLSRSFEPFIDFGTVPASGTFLFRPEDPYRSIPLSFEFCAHCGVIRRSVPLDFVPDYRSTIHTTGHRRLPYLDSLVVPSLREMGVGWDSLIVEVGANDGTFLDVLRHHGFSNLAAIEPSARCAEILRAKGYRCWERHFDSDHAGEIRRTLGPAAVVVCRHTLEHISHPHLFLESLASLLAEDGILFVEVPDATRIIDDLHGYILWDEHLYNFFADSLAAMFSRSGLEIIRNTTGTFRTVRTLLCWGRRRRGQADKPAIDTAAPALVKRCRCFAARWKEFSSRLRSAAGQWPGPIACLGASHPQTNFLTFTGLNQFVSVLVDDDRNKVGQYVPLWSPVPVVPSDQLVQAVPVKTIVRTAFGCDEWMDALCGSLQKWGVRIVDPFEILKKKSIDHPIRIFPGPGGQGIESSVIGPLEPAHRD